MRAFYYLAMIKAVNLLIIRILYICLLSICTTEIFAYNIVDGFSASSDTLLAKTNYIPGDTLPSEKLELVNVLGSKLPLNSQSGARVVATITRKESKAAPSQSLNDLLKYSSSVDVRQRGPIGAQTDIGIRGGNYEQVAILLNGVNISDPQTGHNSFDLPISMLQVESVEILEGPANKISGVASLLGAINIRAYCPDNDLFLANIEGGSYGYFQFSALGNFVSKFGRSKLKSNISASYIRSDGYSRSDNNHLNMDYKTVKSLYQGSFLSPLFEFNWHAGISSKGFGSNRFYANFDEQYESTFKTFTAFSAKNLKGRLVINPTIYWNHYQDRFELFRGDSISYPFNYHKTNIYGVNLNSYFSWVAGTTAFGGEIRKESTISGNLGEPLSNPKKIKGTNRFYDYGLDRINRNFFVEHNYQYKRLSLSAAIVGLKNSWAKMKMRFLPSVEASYRIYQREYQTVKLFASYNSSVRMPSVTELYYSVGGYKADKHLKPERVVAFEGGVKYSSPRIVGELSFFSNRMTHLIDWITTTTSDNIIWQSVNFGKINSVGLSSNFRYSFSTLPQNIISLKSISLSYSHIEQNKGENVGIQSQYVLEYLRDKLVANLNFSICKNLEFSLFYRFQDRVGGYLDTQGLYQKYKPYSLVDLKIDWQFKGLNCYIQANNLLSKKYVDFGRIPQPRFWFVGGCSITIQK